MKAARYLLAAALLAAPPWSHAREAGPDVPIEVISREADAPAPAE